MVLYFTATGNSKYVATRIATAFNDRTVSIPDCMQHEEYSFELSPGEYLSIISPVYYLGFPTIVRDFLNRFSLTTNGKTYVCFIATYGVTPGGTGHLANKYMQKKGYLVNAKFGVKMPDTWTPVFDLSNKEKIKRTNDKAEMQIDEIIKKMSNKATGDFLHYKTPLPVTKIAYYLYEGERKTKHFSVTDACIGCGKCAANCPVHAIEMQQAKPVWIKDTCAICLGCLHRCPKFAIQYGKNTQKHGQYTHPDTLS
ncbi:MAG: EFR1 family ferrodoxin [Spirochaetia bacterium]|jgi:NAD-dependent dihydropyrimidine dehydrogenase PreA subunit|nr:EFR1 family ferrodoxin [Spirochaetia bacterium]